MTAGDGAWPDGVLAGRYALAARDARGGQELVVTGGEGPAFVVYRGGRQQLPHLPPDVPDRSIKICALPSRAPVLVIVWRYPVDRHRLRSALAVTYEVIDHRLRTRIGSLHVTGGSLCPRRIRLRGPSGRTLATMAERRSNPVAAWLRAGPVRYELERGRDPIGRIVPREAAPGTYDVDLADAVAHVDPRLLLAAAVERLEYLTDF